MTYWIKDYIDYLKNENAFDPVYLPKFTRGSIVEINLGYNIGSEYGGLHYGIVLNKKDHKKNPNLTIVPMSSRNTKIHKTEVDLGNEFYNIFNQKINLLSEQCITDMNLLEKQLNLLTHTDFDVLKKYEDTVKELQKRISTTKNKINSLEKCKDKIKKLKQGGVALISQITTISKMRVNDPINPNEPLYNIHLSTSTMEEIDKKITQLFIKTVDTQ